MRMKHKIADYTVIIERQKRIGTNKLCYMAYVPALGIATDAGTIESIEKDVKSLIEFHLESLVEEGESIPLEAEKAFVTRSHVNLPKGASFVQ